MRQRRLRVEKKKDVRTMGHDTRIYYFSGSGNSLAVARRLAERLDGEVVPLVRELRRTTPDSSADVVGVVFPTYDFHAPKLVTDWLDCLERIQDMYLFAVSTYGIGAGRTHPKLRKFIEVRGASLAGGFALPMPHNGVGCGLIKDRIRAKRVAGANARIEEIAHYVRDRRTGHVEWSWSAASFVRPEILRMLPSAVRLLVKLATGGAQALAFQAGEICTQCGTCSRVCPVTNIVMVDGSPRWRDRCVNCFACLHWCPTNAISLGGLDLRIAQYHHPDVTLEDMVTQKRKPCSSL
jgi:ferredoxin/flavodoxin